MAGGGEQKNGESYIKHLGQIPKGYKLSSCHLQALEDTLWQIKVPFVF